VFFFFGGWVVGLRGVDKVSRIWDDVLFRQFRLKNARVRVLCI
jgi:hypothetical protein